MPSLPPPSAATDNELTTAAGALASMQQMEQAALPLDLAAFN